jgi:hypothetical protein
MKKMLSNLMVTAVIGLMVWIGISYVDIIRQNGQPNPQYTDWNAIVMFTETAMEYHNM